MTIEPRARQAGGLTGFIREALGLEIECNVQDLRHWTAGDWFLLQQAETALPGVIVDASVTRGINWPPKTAYLGR